CSRRVPTLSALDEGTRTLVRLSAIVAAGSERAIGDALSAGVGSVSGVWVEELILQSYLFAGFPRALNAMREWRRALAARGEQTRGDAGANLSPAENDADALERWRALGEETCRRV